MYGYLGGAFFCSLIAWYLKKKGFRKSIYEAVLILGTGFFLAFLLWQVDENSKNQRKILRNPPGQGQEEKDYLVNAEGILEQYPMRIQIEEKRLTENQKKEYLEKAKQELELLIFGENDSLEQVEQSLYLPEVLQEGAVEAEYGFSDYEVFDAEGNFVKDLKEPVLVEVTAELSCQEERCLYTFFVRAVPRKKTEQELFADKLKGALIQENRKMGKESVELPEELEGRKISWDEQKENRSLVGLFLGAAGAAGIILAEKEREKNKERKRHRQMLLDYPEIVSTLSLLLGAGMNLTYAWEKIAASYQKRRENQEMESREAYDQMVTTIHEIQEGVGELQAFENFGERCEISVYRKLSSLIVQNIRRGAKGMQRLLEEEAWEAFEQRKAQARKAGEEASTKLLLPMGMMLVIVLVILVVPAGLSINV